jgi:hypothetical protein
VNKTINIKKTTMKTLKNFRNSLFLGCLALGTLGLLTPGLTLAEGKGASKLMSAASTSQTQAQAASTNPSPMCSRCTDGYSKVADTSAKGMNAGTMRNVAVHLCASCQTRIVSVGAGKTKTDKAVHSCGNTATAQASCCMAAR